MTITVNSVAETWQKVNDQNGRSQYARPSHTMATQNLVTFSTISPTRRGSDLGVHKSRVKIQRGDVDADGNPRVRETLCTLEFSAPIANDSTILTDLVDVIEALSVHSTILPDLTGKGLVPQAESL